MVSFKRKLLFAWSIILVATISTGCINKTCETPIYGYKIIHSYPHDTLAFTEGLSFYNGLMIEGTGIPGHSSLRKYRLNTSEILNFLSVSKKYFAEGITIFDNKIVQITEDANIAFIYKLDDLSLVDSFNYSTRGWGIAWNGVDLIMSDGSANLYFLDTIHFNVHRTIKVSCCDTAVDKLNELEFVDGEIFANIWPGTLIACISPDDGRVKHWINLEGMLDPVEISQEGLSILQGYDLSLSVAKEACPNGIAYNPATGKLFVTGKLWPAIFEIEITEKTSLN